MENKESVKDALKEKAKQWAANKLAAKKPEAKKPEAKKPEAKKPEAKKPEAKKPEAKKPEAKKEKANKKLKSVSGKYTSIRNLIETVFAKNRESTKTEIDALVLKEFPESKYNAKAPNTHFPWYKTRIVTHEEFVTIKPPTWVG